MKGAEDYFSHAELALASYADFPTGDVSRNALRTIGMPYEQARHFALQWRVVDQYNHISAPYAAYDETGEFLGPATSTNGNGLSATVFEEIVTGKRCLAIRGTDDRHDLATDIVSLALLGTTRFQAQYQSLEQRVRQWLSDGTLSPSFTVTGHSLGGFLATGLVADFGAIVEHAYLFNAPGVRGMTKDIPLIMDAIGASMGPVPQEKVSNVRAEAGISPIAGLGSDVVPPVMTVIENQFLSDVRGAPLAGNHSQQVLTDALSVYALFAEMSPTLSFEATSNLLRSASHQNGSTLESALDAARTTFGIGKSTPIGDGEALYQNLCSLRNGEPFKSAAGTLSVRVLVGLAVEVVADEAKTGFGHFLAVKQLLPFAVAGSPGVLIDAYPELYAEW